MQIYMATGEAEKLCELSVGGDRPPNFHCFLPPLLHLCIRSNERSETAKVRSHPTRLLQGQSKENLASGPNWPGQEWLEKLCASLSRQRIQGGWHPVWQVRTIVALSNSLLCHTHVTADAFAK